MNTRQSRATAILIGLLAIGALVLGINYFFRPLERLYPASDVPVATIDPELVQPTPTIDPVDRWFEQLSDEERIDQLLALPYQVDSQSTQAATPIWSTEVKPGFVTLFGSEIDIIRASQAATKLKFGQDPTKPQLALLVDHEGGQVQRLSGNGFTVLPSWRQQCQQESEQNRLAWRQSARELASVGIAAVLAPMIDVATRSAVLGDRVCSGDPALVASTSATFVEAFLQEGVWSTLKHYPGIGATRRDLHDQFDIQDVTSSDVAPFHSVLRQHPTLPVMTSLMGVAGLEYEEPCALNAECVALLRDTYQKTLLITDSLTMEAAAYDPATQDYTRTIGERAVRALEAGNHVILFGPDLSAQDVSDIRQVLLTLYQLELTPNTFRDQVDAAVRRVLEFKQYQVLQPGSSGEDRAATQAAPEQ